MTAYAEEISVKHFQKVIEIYHPSMDDFLYIYDLKNDFYCISSSAVERFNVPDHQFQDASKVFEKLVYPEDQKLLAEELEAARRGEREFHNLEYRWLDHEGNAVWINCRGSVIKDRDGVACFLIGCINEIGRNQKADNVSGLLRESGLCKELEMWKTKETQGFMLRFGIDQFKEINENKGMAYGDMILRKTAECIKAAIAPEQKLYRIMADEFMVVDFLSDNIDVAGKLYKKIRKKIDEFIESNGYEVFYTLSAGVLEFQEIEDKSYDNLMKLSEFALSEAKFRGRNQCYIYVQEDYNAFLRKRRLIDLMRKAINHDFEGFETYYQPIMDIRENHIYGAETLLRFRTEETGPVSPVEFIPMLEESGLIIPVGKWVLDQAMAACSEIQQIIPDFRVSVNLSYIQILKSNVLVEITEGMEKYNLQPGSIMVELTESGLLETNANFQNFCEGLKKYSISLALDDFGTGYSNFHYLYHLSPDTIKIDRSFTLRALNYDYEYNILKHMVNMSHGISLKLCVEGIETVEELNKISEIGPDYIQGYYFGRPVNLQQFREQHLQNIVIE
uniref:bifunctional diguanylate cyclase/phosphodiesterase n=1 Tax=Acetatifactor sp. TaxID=1872090 RepID=UPI004056D095